MKFKATFLAAVAVVAFAFASCGTKQSETAAEDKTISVDSVFANADALVGDTLDVEGYCSHLCSHGGRKAFLVGADSANVLRCEATAEMGGAFAPDTKGKTLIVKGILCENRIDSAAVDQMEARYAEADAATAQHESCDTEKKALGQGEIDSFQARMEDFRSRIAARAAEEGKPYLSNFFLQAISYTVVGEDTEEE